MSELTASRVGAEPTPSLATGRRRLLWELFPSLRPEAPEPEPVGTSEGKALSERMQRRLNALIHGSDILRIAVPTDPLLESVRQVAATLQPEIEALGLTASAPPESEVELLQASLDRIQAAVLAVDATVPMLLFRRRVELELFPGSVLEGYLSLLCQHLGADPDRRDRIDLIVTHLCSTAREDGTRSLRAFSEVEALLEKVSWGHRAPARRRGPAIEFFEKTRWKVARYRTAESVFENKDFSDIYGLKLALGEDFLDPAILHAAASLNVTLHNLFTRSRISEEQTDRTKEEVRETLVTSHNSSDLQEASHFERLRAAGRLALEGVYDHRVWRQMRRRKILRVAASLLVAAGLAALLVDSRPRHPELALAPAQVHALSPVLLGGDTVGGRGAKILSARVDPFEWKRLDAEGRRFEAESLARQLDRQTSLRSAAVMLEGELVIYIQGGKVVFVR